MNKTVLLATLAAALLLPGCVSETKAPGPLVWRDGAGTAPAASPAAAPAASPQATRSREPEPGEVVSIPEDVMMDLMRFVNRVQLVVADRIEVDATRVPFQVAMVPLADPNFVETVEMAAQDIKATGFLLRSRVERPMVESDFCRLRIGDGIELVAGREIQMRCYSTVDPDRPAYLLVRASGHAVYSDPASGRRIEADGVVMQIAVVKVGGRMVLRQSIR